MEQLLIWSQLALSEKLNNDTLIVFSHEPVTGSILQLQQEPAFYESTVLQKAVNAIE